jgi:hypothetical protein
MVMGWRREVFSRQWQISSVRSLALANFLRVCLHSARQTLHPAICLDNNSSHLIRAVGRATVFYLMLATKSDSGFSFVWTFFYLLVQMRLLIQNRFSLMLVNLDSYFIQLMSILD